MSDPIIYTNPRKIRGAIRKCKILYGGVLVADDVMDFQLVKKDAIETVHDSYGNNCFELAVYPDGSAYLSNYIG